MNYKEGEVNFWSTRTTSVNTENNIPFFFKTEDSKIVGMALLVRKESLTVEEMWNRYGNMNGIESRLELEELFSKNKPVEKASCLILGDFVIFKNAIDLSAIGLERWLTVKYIKDSEIVDRILMAAGIISISGEEQILNPDAVIAKYGKTLINSRTFQNKLRAIVLKYYNYKCLFCGIDVDKLLIVSHIKDVSVSLVDAGNPFNTLLLCRLHDGMFDSKLISVDNDNRIIIGDILKKSRSEKLQREIKELESTSIDRDLKKSREFLEWHRASMQKGSKGDN